MPEWDAGEISATPPAACLVSRDREASRSQSAPLAHGLGAPTAPGIQPQGSGVLPANHPCATGRVCPGPQAVPVPEDQGLQDGPAHPLLYRQEAGPAREWTCSGRLARPKSWLPCSSASRNGKLDPSRHSGHLLHRGRHVSGPPGLFTVSESVAERGKQSGAPLVTWPCSLGDGRKNGHPGVCFGETGQSAFLLT